MKPVEQRIIDKKIGDCLKCCVASILELPYEDVPNFAEYYDMPQEPGATIWWTMFEDFLRKYNYLCFNWFPDKNEKECYPKGYHIGSGLSGMFDDGTSHAVVMLDGEIVFDPNPNKTGVKSIDSYKLFIPFVGGKNA